MKWMKEKKIMRAFIYENFNQDVTEGRVEDEQ